MKKLFSLFLALFASVSLWAITKDLEGYYILASAQDWIDFADTVENRDNAANARMVADIDLGDNQTMIGSDFHHYNGIFDGQGHTLTVAYNSVSGNQRFLAPFRFVDGRNLVYYTNPYAIIKNLHVAGSITNSYYGVGGIVGEIKGNVKILQCWCSARLQAVATGDFQGTIGGICCIITGESCEAFVEDCMFTGEIVNSYACGGFMSHLEFQNSTVTIKRGLLLGTYPESTGSCGTFVRTVVTRPDTQILETNTLFMKKAFGVSQGTLVDDNDLNDGWVTNALQADREEVVWYQDNMVNQPRLQIFTTPIGPSTAIDAVNANDKTTKRFVNDQLLIERGNRVYTLTGQQVK